MSFKKFATLQKTPNGDRFIHIGLEPKFRSTYGLKTNDIIYEVEFEISQDQSPVKDRHKTDYWGWLNIGEEEDKMMLIWPTYLQFSVCFMYGVSVEEKNGNGKSYRLEVKSFKKILIK